MVGNQCLVEVVDSSWVSCSVARTLHFVGNISADSKANSRFPDEVVVGHSSRTD